MKNIFITVLLLCMSVVAYTQIVTIIDYETGKPLESVTLESEAPKAFSITDAQGQTDISAFGDAENIEIRLLGYKTEKVSYADLNNTGFTVYLVLTGVSLDELVISVNRFEEKQQNVIQKIQVLRKSELQQMNQTSMADVVANSGNIMVQKSQQGGGSPIIRGFETNKVLMVVDGVRMNNAIYRGGHLQNVITLDNSIMERVELVYGPGSVVYGSDALGGVMHFYTRNPTLSTTDKMMVKAESYARYFSASSGFAAHTNVSLGSQKFGSLTSLTYSKFGDLRQGAIRNPFYDDFGSRPWYAARINGMDASVVNPDPNVQLGSGYTQYDLLQKIVYQQSDKISHSINLQYSTSSDIPRYDRLTLLSGNQPRFAEWYYGPQKRLFASYNLLMDEETTYYDKAQLIVGYQNIEESRITRRFNGADLNHQYEKLDILTFNLDFDKKIKNHDIRYGVDFWWNKVNSRAFSEDIDTKASTASDTRYPDGGSTMNSLAIYATHTWELNPKVVISDGLRISNIGLTSKFVDKSFFPFPFEVVSQNNTAINGNIGLLIKPQKDLKFSLNFASGFRAPNVDDLSKVFESVPGNVIVPNPNLKPEKTYTGELSVEKTFDKSFTISATGYYTLYKNALTVQPTQFEGQDSILFDGRTSRVTSTVNAGEAYLYGFEGRMVGNLNEFLSIVGTINYTYGRIKTDTTDYPLDHIPPIFGKLGLNFTKDKFRSEFFVNYSGWKRLKDYNLVGEDNYAYATIHGMPSWYTLNARLNYQLAKSLSLQIACENILDQNYRVFASNISAPGRNFIFTLRNNF
jgi:hemoglobin/transferrin/lactoferrin receptor protein